MQLCQVDRSQLSLIYGYTYNLPLERAQVQPDAHVPWFENQHLVTIGATISSVKGSASQMELLQLLFCKVLSVYLQNRII